MNDTEKGAENCCKNDCGCHKNDDKFVSVPDEFRPTIPPVSFPSQVPDNDFVAAVWWVIIFALFITLLAVYLTH
jgi:hypothetical protein